MSLKSEKNKEYFTRIHFSIYLAYFFLESEVFQIDGGETIKTHFVFGNFFSKIVPFMR